MATRRFGSNFLSVGRVQSPTLGLIVQRRLERRAHEPEPFWEVTASFAHPDGSFTAEHTTDRFWKKEEAEAAVANSKSPGTVNEISARKNTRQPPAPLNTTAFTTDALNRLGITPSPAMRIAEDLYMDGYISYPQTDNTVYPKSLATKELVEEARRDRRLQGCGVSPRRALAGADPRQAGDDRPSADLPDAGGQPEAPRGPLGGAPPRLRAGRPPLPGHLLAADGHRVDPRQHRDRPRARYRKEWLRTRIPNVRGETYFVRGSVVIDPGFAAIYTYARSADTEIPKLEEGQQLDLEKTASSWRARRRRRRPGSVRAS